MKFFGSAYTRTFSRRGALLFALALLLPGCAATRPPDVTTPRSPDSGYPIVINDDLSRREASLAAWRNLVGPAAAGAAQNPELLPITATIQKLPEIPAGALTLPAVGKTSSPSEEEMRESVRRFLNSAGSLVCGDLDQLTLVQRVDEADGTHAAIYEQRPFRYRLRGNYGSVRIGFANDRRIVQLVSSCLPELNDAQRDIQTLRPDPSFTPAKIASILIGHTFTTPSGAVSVASKDDFTLTEPVLVVRETETAPRALEVRLAWEVTLKNGSPVYVDAIDGSLLPNLLVNQFPT
jgi:hypothetical protein